MSQLGAEDWFDLVQMARTVLGVRSGT